MKVKAGVTGAAISFRNLVEIMVIKHIIHSHLMKFFEDQNILTDYQHGFLKKRSCESQLITTIQDLASGIDSSIQIGVGIGDNHQRIILQCCFLY
jgi:hypothetical protein